MFGKKIDFMSELNKEKQFLWDDLNIVKEQLKKEISRSNALEKQNLKYKKDIEELNKNAPEHYNQIKNTSISVTTLKNRIKSRTDELKTYLEEASVTLATLSNSDDKASELLTDISNKHEQMLITYADLKLSNDDIFEKIKETTANVDILEEIVATKSSLEDSVNTIVEQSELADGTYNKIIKQHNSIVNIRKQISEVCDDLFGYDYENDDGETEHVTGKVDYLDNTYKKIESDLSEFYKRNKDYCEKLDEKFIDLENIANNNYVQFLKECEVTRNEAEQRIDDLLPKALTAGLAAAYDDKVSTESSDLKSHNTSFKSSVILLVLISLLPLFVVFIPYVTIDKSIGDSISDLRSFAPFLIPLYTPVLWWGYSANKKYKLSKRLIEEYTHKGVLSRTFEGLSKQVQDMPDDSMTRELKSKLLYNLIDVNSENPGKLISDYNKSDHPLMDALDKSSKLADSVTKLARVPGFSALAKRLDERSKELLDSEGHKIKAVLESESANDATNDTIAKDNKV